MPSAGLEPTISAIDRLQTHALKHTGTGIDDDDDDNNNNINNSNNNAEVSDLERREQRTGKVRKQGTKKTRRIGQYTHTSESTNVKVQIKHGK